mgnify:CR=1 FL=1
MLIDIEVGRLSCCSAKHRAWHQGQPRDGMKRSHDLGPLDSGIFNPKTGILVPAAISHVLDVQKLHAEIEGAHDGILVEVPFQLVGEGIGTASVERRDGIVRRRACGELNDICGAVPESNRTPVAQLLVWLDGLALRAIRCTTDPRIGLLITKR